MGVPSQRALGSADTTHLTVPACDAGPGVEWLAFAGGYTLTERACIPLIVRTTERDYKVKVSAGTSCRTKSRHS